MILDGNQKSFQWAKIKSLQFSPIDKNLMIKENLLLNKQNGMKHLYPTNGRKFFKNILII